MNTKQIIKSIKIISTELRKINGILEATQKTIKPHIKKTKSKIDNYDDEYIQRIIRNGGL